MRIKYVFMVKIEVEESLANFHVSRSSRPAVFKNAAINSFYGLESGAMENEVEKSH